MRIKGKTPLILIAAAGLLGFLGWVLYPRIAPPLVTHDAITGPHVLYPGSAIQEDLQLERGSGINRLAHACGPLVHPVTTIAIIRTESGFDPLIVRDNTTHESLRPRTLADAWALVRARIAAGHRLAIGLMQVTTAWAVKLQLAPELLLDPCTNITVGTTILAANYLGCGASTSEVNSRLACALSTYWAGNGQTGGVYVNRIFQAAGSPVRVAETPGVSDGILQSRALSAAIPAVAAFRVKGRLFSFPRRPIASFSFSH